VNRSDLPAVARTLAELGQLLARPTTTARGTVTVAEAALDAAREFAPGQQAARLEPAGGRRTEEIVWPEGETERVDLPQDPAGELAIAGDPTLHLAGDYLELMRQADEVARRLKHTVDGLLPPQPGTLTAACGECGTPRLVTKRGNEKRTSADLALEGWCRSCYRDGQRHEPITTDRRGNRYYRDVCKWCGGFKAKHGIDPPLELLEYRHRYGRLPTRELDRVMAKAKSAAPRSKTKRKRRKA